MTSRGDRSSLLHAWAALLATATGQVWASVPLAGLKVLVEAAKRDPRWSATVPSPPEESLLSDTESRTDSLASLEHALLECPPANIDRERIAELLGYNSLWREYDGHHKDWTPAVAGPPILAPFVEVWTNLRPSSPDLPIRFVKHPQEKYRAPVVAQELGSRADAILGSKQVDNDGKVGIRGVRSDEGNLVLEFQYCNYSDYVRTNWAIANLPPAPARELRTQLCGTGRLLPIEKSRCSNHLGVSAILSFEGEILLPTSSHKTVSSPNMLVPSVSGSADFESSYWGDAVPKPSDDILREAGEELGITKEQFQGCLVRFLALGRNVLRGGKPEAFFMINLCHGAPNPGYCLEIAERPFVRLPALLDDGNRPVHDFDEREADLRHFVSCPSYEDFAISPFTRVALYYYMAWARAKRGDDLS